MRVDRKVLSQTNQKPSTQENLPLVVTFNKMLPNIKNVFDKHWHIISFNQKNKITLLIKNRSLSN